MSKPLALRGVMSAIVTPFKPDLSVDEEALRKYVTEKLSAGVTGVLVNGYTGEIDSLSTEEWERSIRICKSEVGDSMPLLTGLAAGSLSDAVHLGKLAREAGADVLQINSPYKNLLRRGFIHDETAVLDYFKSLDQQVGLPMTIFQYPTWSGLTYPSTTLAALAGISNVVGVKEAVDLDTFADDFDLLHGRVSILADHNGYTLLPMLLMGADGTMVGISNVGTALYVELAAAVEAKDFARAVTVMNENLAPLMRVFSRHLGQTATSFISRMKQALVMLGSINSAAVRPPETPPGDAEIAEVRRALVAAGLLAQ
jgi:4-hydroxy-tetrahydrodipicolinate synthase